MSKDNEYLIDYKPYMGNHQLKRDGIAIEWNSELIKEYAKCAQDCIYFIKNYMKIINVDNGLISFIPYDYQEDMLNSMTNNRFTIIATARQAGKTSSIVGYILWYILFHDDKTVALLANKGDTAREILGRVQLAYQYLPKWLQQGVLQGGWNKGSISLENNSRVIASSSSDNNIRGYSINCVVGDTFVTVKDKETGFINTLMIDQLALLLKKRHMNYGFIYLTENLINGKKYIGAHRIGKKNNYLGSGKYFKHALKKYGKENFKQIILEFVKTEEELFEKEKYHIFIHNAVIDTNYYNLSSGGKNPILYKEKNGFFNKKHTPETKLKLSLLRKNSKLSNETKKKISNTLKEKFATDEYKKIFKNRKSRSFTNEQKLNHSKILTGRKLSEETKQKISNSLKGNIPWNKGKKKYVNIYS